MMNGWNIAIICLMSAGVAISLAKHGEPKKEKHNFYVVLASTALNAWILYKAGLWS